jgi:glucosamine-6-phosphate deaminase
LDEKLINDAARLVNELEIDLRHAHFWGMDEWVNADGVPVPVTHPLSFAKADKEPCFNRIRPDLRMPDVSIPMSLLAN